MEGKEGINALFLHATEGILVSNEFGEITSINPSAEKLFGYAKGELIGKKIEVLVPGRLTQRHESHRDKYSGNPHARSMGAGMDLYAVKKDGSEFPVEISLSPYSTDGGKYVIAFIVDITTRKMAEEKLKNYSIELEKQVKDRTLILEEAIAELERTKKDLHKALEKEMELNELKSRFVSMASHEFRTPLTTMMSSLALMARYQENNDIANIQKHMGKLKVSINYLTDMLNDFLSVSKLEEGKIENTPEDINLREQISDVVTEMQPLTQENQQIVQVHAGPDLVRLDRKLLRNVLFNLVSNAIKFSTQGGTIEVRSEVTDSHISISVRDEGIGISKEDQRHLFERFFRGQNAVHIQGTGLGLNIVAKYAELMQGTIGFTSEVNVGSTFTLRLNRLK